MRSPSGWKGINQREAVVWQAPRQDAIFALTLAQGRSPRQAAQQFFNQQGVAAVADWPAAPGSSSSGAQFQAQTQQGILLGAVSFFEHGGKLYQLIGFAPQNSWRAHRDEIARAMDSFDRLDDRRYRNVSPMRVEVVTLDRAMTLRELDRRSPSTVNLDELALINHVEADTRLPAGTKVKRVVGGIEGASNTTGG
jgi:predicted Zn-dependent protease